jgi:hypothetical protein
VQHVAERGDGVVVGDLRDALRLHRGGLSALDAFTRIADMTPEPFAARTYRVLGAAEERGADLGSALLALSTRFPSFWAWCRTGGQTAQRDPAWYGHLAGRLYLVEARGRVGEHQSLGR